MKPNTPKTLALLISLSALTVIFGCRGGEEAVGIRVIDANSLLGTWSQIDTHSSETFEFLGGGRLLHRSEYGSEVYESEGQWRLQGNSLQLYDEARDGNYYELEEETIQSAIVDNVLYLGVFIRRSSGNTLEGTWHYSEDENIEIDFPDCQGEATENERSNLSINGSSFTFTEQETWMERGNCEGKTFDESDTEIYQYRGQIRLEGENIFMTRTEEDGVEIPANEQIEEHWGYFLSEHVIVYSRYSDATQAEDLGYAKIR